MPLNPDVFLPEEYRIFLVFLGYRLQTLCEKMATLRKKTKSTKRIYSGDEIATFFSCQIDKTGNEMSDSDIEASIFDGNHELRSVASSTSEGSSIYYKFSVYPSKTCYWTYIYRHLL